MLIIKYIHLPTINNKIIMTNLIYILLINWSNLIENKIIKLDHR